MVLNLFVSSLVLLFMLMFGHRLSKRGSSDLSAIQSSHTRLTVRFGGVAIICGVSSIFYSNMASGLVMIIFLSGAPIFLGGFLEDITGKISPRIRLLGAFASSSLVIIFTGLYIPAGDFWLLDGLFVFPIVAIPITVLIASGVANSFNIIDGVNGFSAGLALIIACMLGYLCGIYGENDLSYFCYMIAVAIVPFLTINFPVGFIFLGDAGAYTLGHLLSWIAIALISRQPEISAWALLLLFFWPTAEILLSIYRRIMSKKPYGAPDSLHFHQLIVQLLQLSFGKKNLIHRWSNPLSTLILLPLAVIPIIVSWMIIRNNGAAILVYIVLAIGYLLLYILLLRKVKAIAINDGKKEIIDNLSYVFSSKKE